MEKKLNRRNFFRKSLLATTGTAVALSFEEKALLARPAHQSPAAHAPKQKIPTGKIKDLEVTRIICGGNLTSGFAHSRDLIYVSQLLRHYFTDDKIFETWQKCEENGINTAILRVDNQVIRLINEYWNKIGGSIQWIAQCKIQEDDIKTDIMRAIDNGCDAAYLHGGVGDSMVAKGKIDLIAKAVDLIKQNGIPAGVAGHSIGVHMTCEKEGVDADFYMKTVNSSNYWTAGPRLPKDPNWQPNPPAEIVEPEYGANEHDNIWTRTPQKTIEFMQTVKRPWIGYKVLGAGAIHPKEGFKYAFEAGADFICVGMFDYQVEEDVAIAVNTLNSQLNRKRPWMA